MKRVSIIALCPCAAAVRLRQRTGAAGQCRSAADAQS